MEGFKTDVSAFLTDKKRSLHGEEQNSPKRVAMESPSGSCHPVFYEVRAQGTERDISQLPTSSSPPSSVPIPSLAFSRSRRNLRASQSGEDDSCAQTSSPASSSGISSSFQPSSSPLQTVASSYLIYSQNHERCHVRRTPELQYRLPGVDARGSQNQAHEQRNCGGTLTGRGRGSCGAEMEASNNKVLDTMNQEAEDLDSQRTQLQQVEKAKRDRFNLSRYQLDDEEAVAITSPIEFQFVHQLKQQAGKPARDRFDLSRYQLEDEIIAPGPEIGAEESKQQLQQQVPSSSMDRINLSRYQLEDEATPGPEISEDESEQQPQQQVPSSSRDRFNLSRYQLDDEDAVGPKSENVQVELNQHLQSQVIPSPRDRYSLSRYQVEEEVVAPGSEDLKGKSKQRQEQSPPTGRFSLSRYQPKDEVVVSKPGTVKHLFRHSTSVEQEEHRLLNRFKASRSQSEGGTVFDARISEEKSKHEAFPSEKENMSQFGQHEGGIPLHGVRNLQTQSKEQTPMSSSDRLQNFRRQQAGKVVIPETWEGEQKLQNWVGFGDVEEAMRPLGLMMARAALVTDSVDYTKRAKASSSGSSLNLKKELAA